MNGQSSSTTLTATTRAAHTVSDLCFVMGCLSHFGCHQLCLLRLRKDPRPVLDERRSGGVTQTNVVDDSSSTEGSVAGVNSTNTTSIAKPTSRVSADRFNRKPVVEYPTTAVASTVQERRRSANPESVVKHPHGAFLVLHSDRVCFFFFSILLNEL